MNSPAKRAHLQQEDTPDPENKMDVQNSAEATQLEEEAPSPSSAISSDSETLRKHIFRKITAKQLRSFA